jgi:hypothetical protein
MLIAFIDKLSVALMESSIDVCVIVATNKGIKRYGLSHKPSVKEVEAIRNAGVTD